MLFDVAPDNRVNVVFCCPRCIFLPSLVFNDPVVALIGAFFTAVLARHQLPF